MIRADGATPLMPDMLHLFGRHGLFETIQTGVPVPRHPNRLGCRFVFRNIGNYNDLCFRVQESGDTVWNTYRLIAN